MGREPDLKIGSSLPGIGAGGWPFRRYSTPSEFNNSRNSRRSLFSGIGVTAVAEFDQDIQALLGGLRRVCPWAMSIGRTANRIEKAPRDSLGFSRRPRAGD